MSQLGRLFSTISNFCKKEAGLARNVKDRQNSRITVRNLEKIINALKLLKDKDLELGLFIFSGTDIHSEEILTLIEPKTKCSKFSYRCLNKFIVDNAYEYFKVHNGSIIFANGDTFYIYTNTEKGFEKIDYKKVDLGNRHNKGGQSQHRHERNFDIVKDFYIKTIAESVNCITTENNWIFGSPEIISKVISKCPKLQNGGFLEFNKYTIDDTKKWLDYLRNDEKQIKKESEKLEQIVALFQTDPDRLDFNQNNKELIEYYVINSSEEIPEEIKIISDSVIYLSARHKQYAQLCQLPYIGVKYRGQVLDEE